MILTMNQRQILRHLSVSLLLSFSMPTLAATSLWQSPYAGVYLGGSVVNTHTSTSAGNVTDTSYFTTPADINAVNNAGTQRENSNTIIVGIQAGHDWAWKRMIYGVALDYGTFPFSSSSTTTNTYPDNASQYSVYTSMQTNWLLTLRGRLGYPTILCLPSLFYLTGGMAMTQLKVHNNFNDNSALAGSGGSSTTQNQIGWTAGAGIEVAILKHTSINLEYLYVGIPSIKTIAAVSNSEAGFGIPIQSMTSPLSTTTTFHANVFRVGLNYRFDE